MSGRHGFILIKRRLLEAEHEVLRTDEEIIAFERIISRCAYASRTDVLHGRRIAVKRAQFATSARDLAEFLGWSKSRTHRFLRRLEAYDMVICAPARMLGTLLGTGCGTHSSYQCSVVTVCNYEKHQSSAQSYPHRVGQVVGQVMGQVSADLFDPKTEFAPNKFNKFNKQQEKESGGGTKQGKRYKRPPRFGDKSPDGKEGFVPLDHPQWCELAAEYRDVRGVDPQPRQGGFWFVFLGEAARAPARQFRQQEAKPWKMRTTPGEHTEHATSPEPSTASSGSNAIASGLATRTSRRA